MLYSVLLIVWVLILAIRFGREHSNYVPFCIKMSLIDYICFPSTLPKSQRIFMVNNRKYSFTTLDYG